MKAFLNMRVYYLFFTFIALHLINNIAIEPTHAVASLQQSNVSLLHDICMDRISAQECIISSHRIKIAVIGNGGSGKSTLAFQLHKKLHLPLFHLDQYFWKPGWQQTDDDEFTTIHNNLCMGDTWIIEGIAMRLLEPRLERADVIIFLDIPLYRCLYRIFKRAFFNFGKVSFASAPGCPEKFPDPEFLKHVWNFNTEKKPTIERLLEQYKDQKKIFIITNKQELHQLFQDLTTK